MLLLAFSLSFGKLAVALGPGGPALTGIGWQVKAGPPKLLMVPLLTNPEEDPAAAGFGLGPCAFPAWAMCGKTPGMSMLLPDLLAAEGTASRVDGAGAFVAPIFVSPGGSTSGLGSGR